MHVSFQIGWLQQVCIKQSLLTDSVFGCAFTQMPSVRFMTNLIILLREYMSLSPTWQPMTPPQVTLFKQQYIQTLEKAFLMCPFELSTVDLPIVETSSGCSPLVCDGNTLIATVTALETHNSCSTDRVCLYRDDVHGCKLHYDIVLL